MSTRVHWSFPWLTALVAIVLLSQACGASALQRSAQAAQVSHALLNGAATSIDTVCDVATVEASADPATRARRCLQAAESYDLAVASLNTWVTALLVAAEDDDAVEGVRELAGPVVRQLAALADLLQTFGVDVPSVPSWLIAFAEGVAT